MIKKLLHGKLLYFYLDRVTRYPFIKITNIKIRPENIYKIIEGEFVRIPDSNWYDPREKRQAIFMFESIRDLKLFTKITYFLYF